MKTKRMFNLLGALMIIISLSITSCDKDNDDDNNNSNTSPTASFKVSPSSGTISTNFNFDASASSDKEDPVSSLQVRWDWENDGSWDVSYTTTKTASHQYSSEGAYTVKMEVKDNEGLTNTTTRTVAIEAATGTFTDTRDSKTYNWVRIGNQKWMSENLAYLPAVSPSAKESTTSAYYYVYDYEGTSVSAAKATSNYQTYGVLYNWHAAMNGAGSSSANPSGVQGVCPAGWHLPSDAEWTELADYLGGESVAGGKMKETGTSHWYSPNTGATNSSGFTALPGGARIGSGFVSVGLYGCWWSSTERYSSALNSWHWNLRYNGSYGQQSPNLKRGGLSVRCIGD